MMEQQSSTRAKKNVPIPDAGSGPIGYQVVYIDPQGGECPLGEILTGPPSKELLRDLERTGLFGSNNLDVRAMLPAHDEPC